ncbi:hypothetical protein [Halosimplex carlsbadense]|uniref:hypothetical protein n=1 Tax=Halosimplex carlsbadense TaxID=171164 RepID=UPI0012697D45|nr:hypothetical protein [Halosimplex carlsbadense]
MVDTLELYALYDEPFDDDAQLTVYQRLLELDEFECSTPPAELRRQLATDEDVFLTAAFRSVHLSLVFGSSVPGLPKFPHLLVSIEGTEFEHPSLSADERATKIDDLFEFVRLLYLHSSAAGYSPRYLIGAGPTHIDHLRRDTDFLRTTTGGVRSEELEELYWLQLLPPTFAESVGYDRIQRSPAPRLVELEDGGIIFTAHEHPLEFADDYLRMLDHFGLNRS